MRKKELETERDRKVAREWDLERESERVSEKIMWERITEKVFWEREREEDTEPKRKTGKEGEPEEEGES